MSIAKKLAKIILEDPSLRSVFDAMKKSDRFSEELVLFITKPAAKKLGEYAPAPERRAAARILAGPDRENTLRRNPARNIATDTTPAHTIKAGTFDALRKSK